MRRLIRGIIDSVVEGAIKRISIKGISGEQLTDRELFQHYGFTSRPLAGAEGIVIREGNCFYVIAEDDRRYRIALADGEVALYDDQGQAVHLKRGKRIHVYGCDTLAADVGVSTTVTCPQITAVASTKVVLQTPLVQATQDVDIIGKLKVGQTAVVAGALSSQTSVADPTGTMQGMRGTYNGHDHNESGGGITNQPNQVM